MNKYTLDINELIKKRDELQEKVNLYEGALETYQTLIDSYDARVQNHRDDLLEDDEEISILEFIEDILPYTNPTSIELLLKAKDIVINYQNIIKHINLKPLYLNNQQLVDYTMSLISQIPNKKMVDEINSLIKSENNLLHIKHRKKLPTDFFGFSVVNYIDHIPYGVISRENTIQDVITLCHEMFHMVLNKDKPLDLLTHKHDLYTEAEGYLSNLICYDLLTKDHYDEKEITFIRSWDLVKNTTSIINTFVTYTLLGYLKEDDTIRLRDAKKKLKEENVLVKINSKNYKSYFRDSYLSDVNNAFSYLCALDIYNKYQQVPDKAMHNLYTISNSKGTDIITELNQAEITFHQDGYQNLDKECKTLLKKKTTSK